MCLFSLSIKENNEKDDKTENFELFKNLTNFILFSNYNIYQSIKNLYEALSEFSVHCLKNKIKTFLKKV